MAKRGNNEGSIRKRANGTWEARYTIGYKDDGKPNRKSIYGRTREEVKNKLNAILVNHSRGNYVEESNQTFSEWILSWLLDYNKNIVRTSTFETNLGSVKKHIEKHPIGKLPLKKLRENHLQKFYNEKLLEISASTLLRLHKLIKQALSKAVQIKIIYSSPAEYLKPPKTTKPDVRILTREEQKAFMEAIEGERIKLAFMVAMRTGMRRGEILALSWKDVNLEKRVITVRQSISRVKKGVEISDTKTRSGIRTIPISDTLYKCFLEYLEKHNEEMKDKDEKFNPNNLVFYSKVGSPLEPANFIRIFLRVCKKAGIKINFHAIRHTFASRLLEAGENIKIVSELLGHSKTSFTLDTYIHLLPDTKQNAVAKIDFD